VRANEEVNDGRGLAHAACIEAVAVQSDHFFARLNRAELGEFGVLLLYVFLMAHLKGQFVVTDFGFTDATATCRRYGRAG
jgi:hypothetical protein